MKKLLLILPLLIILISFVSASELYLHWKMNESSGTLADSSSNSFTGTALGNPIYQTGNNYVSWGIDSIDFDGTGDGFLNSNVFDFWINFTACFAGQNDAFGTTQSRMSMSTRFFDSVWNGWGFKQNVEGFANQFGAFYVDSGTFRAINIDFPNGWFCLSVNSTTLSNWHNGTQTNTVAITPSLGDAGMNFRVGCGSDDDCGQEWDGDLQEVMIFNGTLTAEEHLTLFETGNHFLDTLPPTNSSWNVTSNNIVSGENSLTWNTGGTINITSDLLSLTVTTNENSNGSCRLDVEQNYTQMVATDSNFKFATTETTSHSYTVFDSISAGNHCLYCSFIDISGNEPSGGTSSSGCLNLTYIIITNKYGNFSINHTEFPDDWTGYSHIQFELSGDNSDNILKIHLKDDDGVIASQKDNFTLDFTGYDTKNISFRDASLWDYVGGTFNFSAMNETKFEIQYQSDESGDIFIDNMRIINYTPPATMWSNCIHNYSTALNTTIISQYLCNISGLQSQFIYLWIDYYYAVWGYDFDIDVSTVKS